MTIILGAERAEDFIMSQLEKPEETLEMILPEKVEEVRLRRQFGSNGKPTTVFPPDGYPDRTSLSRIE